MKFKINNCEWEIIELSQEKIREELSERAKLKIGAEPSMGRYYGITFYDMQKIYLDIDLPIDKKKKTLMHELTHCYIDSFITHQEQTYDEEMVCDIFSNSYDIINEIVEKYFRKEEK